jgi:arylsulfatase A-like enzyme
LRIGTPVSLVDVAPTLLDLLGVPPLPSAQGISPAGAFRGEALPAQRPLFFAWLVEGSEGVRRASDEYLETSALRLHYDLASDPAELSPLAGGSEFERIARETLAEHRRVSERQRKALVGAAPAVAEPALSEETERSLRALGYLE